MNWDNETVVGNKAEASRRGKGMGPSCFITKAFSCHLACRTGSIFYLFSFFLFQAALTAIIKIMASLLPYVLITFLVKPTICRQGPGRGPFSRVCGEQRGQAGQGSDPWPPAQAASLVGTAARREEPVTLTEIFIKGLSCPSPSAVVRSGLFRTFVGFIYFDFINITKNKYFPWDMAVCIPLLTSIYSAPLLAASECLVFSTGSTLRFTPPVQLCAGTQAWNWGNRVQDINLEAAASGAI